MKNDKLKGGKADYKEPYEFDQEQLKKGIQHELEHTNDPEIAEEIAMDHLTEDPFYYDHIKVENYSNINKLFEGWRKHVNSLREAECKIPIENFELSREEMPQIKPEMIQDFILQLQDQGIEVFKTRVGVDQLKPSQGQLKWEKVQQLMKQGFEKLSHGVPIFVSKDNVVADGHHRWYALKMIDKNADMPVWQVQMDILPLVHAMKRFEDTYKGSEVHSDQL